MAFTEGQVAGSIVALFIFVAIYVISLISPLFHQKASTIPFLSRSSSIAIELAGDCKNNKGIYFLPEGTKVKDFLEMNGELHQEYSDKISEIRLLPGNSIMVSRNGSVPLFILQEMNAAQKIALGLPIDINHASIGDIKRIPGIGEKTAAQIISLRESCGMIYHLDELLKIKGIKGKRLTQLKKYFYVDKLRQK